MCGLAWAPWYLASRYMLSGIFHFVHSSCLFADAIGLRGVPQATHTSRALCSSSLLFFDSSAVSIGVAGASNVLCHLLVVGVCHQHPVQSVCIRYVYIAALTVVSRLIVVIVKCTVLVLKCM